MEIVLNILIICLIRICFGQERSLTGQEYYKSANLSQFNNNCSDTWRMISDDDVMKHEKALLDYFTDPVWINGTVRHTPWVIDRGIFNHTLSPRDIIAESNITNYKTHFIECCLFCSKYEWSYIGLQHKKCYCLSSNALENSSGYSVHPAKKCVNGHIPQCPQTGIAVYEKDTNTYQGLEDCLLARFVNNRILSISTTQCHANDTSALCMSKEVQYKEGAHVYRYRTVGYCEAYKLHSVDFKTINLTLNKNYQLDGKYWLNNFRESYVSKPVFSRHLRSGCTFGKVFAGKIQLQATDCDKEVAYTMCIRDPDTTPTHQNTLTVEMDTTVSTEDETIFQNISSQSSEDFNQTTTAKMIPSRRFDVSTPLIIIGAPLYVVILLVMIGR